MARDLRSWIDKGVDLRVYLSTSGDLVIPSTETAIPFTAGGPSGVPSGWTLYLDNPGTMPNNWANSVSGGAFKTGCQTAGYNNITVGAYNRATVVDPNKRYQLRVKCRLQDGRNDSLWNVNLAGYDPVVGDYFWLDAVNDWDATSQLVMASCTQRTAMPARFTRLEILLQGSCTNLNLGTTYNWGVQFEDLTLVAFDATASAITWRDITCDVQALTYRYGRERFTNRYDVATIQLQLKNSEGDYTYANPHPFNLEPGRLVKVEATYGGTMYPQALGVVDQLTDGVSVDGKAVTNVQAFDPTSIFANRPTPTLPGVYRADQRINEIARFLGYPLVLLDVGVWNMQTIEASGRSLRDEMGITADSEGGSVFADRQGNIVYKNRNWLTSDNNLTQVTANLWAKPTSDQPYFDGTPTQPNAPTICLNRLVTDWGLSRVVNYVELANQGGTVYVYENNASQKRYGPRTYSRHDFVLELIGEGNLATRANDIMTGYDVPKLRLNSVGYRPGVDGNDWAWTLRAFLNWLVRVWYQNVRTGWGWLIVTHVQSIEHRITPTEWETTLALDQPTFYGDAPVQNVIAWDDPRAKWDTAGIWT